jgi:hypothetical protein|tara:strand:- start:62 stop:235 length:174 start_codon:yes stop_codon:yes gene_type:complete
MVDGPTDAVTIWEVFPDGLRVYVDGKLVGLIPHDKFPYLIEDLAGGLLMKSRGEYLL